MEIERKYLVKTLPDHLEQYACKVIEQGYLNTNPVVRIRRRLHSDLQGKRHDGA